MLWGFVKPLCECYCCKVFTVRCRYVYEMCKVLYNVNVLYMYLRPLFFNCVSYDPIINLLMPYFVVIALYSPFEQIYRHRKK